MNLYCIITKVSVLCVTYDITYLYGADVSCHGGVEVSKTSQSKVANLIQEKRGGIDNN